MEPQHSDISATILIEVPNTTMHRFLQKESSLFTSGTCKIAKIENPNQSIVYFVNLNSFYYTLNKSVCFVKIQYEDTVSYLFPHFDTGLSAITLLKNSPVLQNFQQILENSSILISWQEAQDTPEAKQKIEKHCPANINTQSIVSADNIKKAIKATGKFIGETLKTIGNYVSDGVKYAGNYVDNKIEQPAEKTEVNPQTKQKWEKLKNGTTSVINVSLDIFNKYLMPLINKGVEYSKGVSKKIQESDNKSAKYALELAGTSRQAITEAFLGLAEGTTKVGEQLGSSTRKIVNKKYGDDYVKTFIPNKQGQEKQEGKTQEETPVGLKQTETKQQKEGLYPKIGEVQELDEKSKPKQ